MEKLMPLRPRTIAMSHLYFYDGYDKARLFFDRSYRATLDYRELIESYLNKFMAMSPMQWNVWYE